VILLHALGYARGMDETRADTADLRELVLERVGRRPFVQHVGAELVTAEAGLVTLRLPWRAEHVRSGAEPGDEPTLHGGVAASLADIAASSALVTVLAPGEGRATIDLSIHYLAPLRGETTAVARVRRRGGRTAVIDIEIAGEDGAIGALARATFAIQPRPRD
jgi:uncharacterized protein (TIGR00369 family)